MSDVPPVFTLGATEQEIAEACRMSLIRVRHALRDVGEVEVSCGAA